MMPENKYVISEFQNHLQKNLACITYISMYINLPESIYKAHFNIRHPVSLFKTKNV